MIQMNIFNLIDLVSYNIIVQQLENLHVNPIIIQ
jgi:hypothetical protein